MITLRDVQQFCERTKSAHSPDQLQELLHEISARMGYRYFALTHHVDLRSNPVGGVQIVNYPQGWIDRFYEKRLFATDPIHRASRTTSIGFCWSDVDCMITLSAGDRAVLANARDAGIGDGFTIPANVPGETNGSCSFAMADGQELESE